MRSIGGFLAAVATWLLIATLMPFHSSAQEVSLIYGDVVTSNSHYADIAALAQDGIFEGTECADNSFCPHQNLSRRTLAVWLVRILEEDSSLSVEQSQRLDNSSRFTDVESDDYAAYFIMKLAEMGITAGCSDNIPRFCPDNHVSRAQAASFLVRAFGLPAGESAGFTDVGDESSHAQAIDSLAANSITYGCSVEPLLFCPDQPVTRAQMTSLLSRALTWKDPTWAAVIQDEMPGTPEDIHLVFEQNGNLIINWFPSSDGSEIHYYQVQWRKSYEDFDQGRQILVRDRNSHSRFMSATLAEGLSAYMIRVVAVNDIGTSASDAILIPTPVNQVIRFMEKDLVEKRGGKHPWLVEAWAHMNQPDFTIEVTELDVSAQVRTMRFYSKPLNTTETFIMRVRNGKIGGLFLDIYLHEMAHVYILTSGISQRPGPIGIAHLYFIHLARGGDPEKCDASELYADTAAGVMIAGRSHYWSRCSYLQKEHSTIEAREVVEQAFSGQIPSWFYDTYENEDGSLDLESVYADIKTMKSDFDKIAVVKQLENEFGGYCNLVQTGIEFRKDYGVRNPWKEGGCIPQAPGNVTIAAGDMQAEIAWQPPASDGGSDITSYVIQWRTENQVYDINRQLVVTTKKPTAVIGNLANGTDYFVRVGAVNMLNDYDITTNNDGLGVFSEELLIQPLAH